MQVGFSVSAAIHPKFCKESYEMVIANLTAAEKLSLEQQMQELPDQEAKLIEVQCAIEDNTITPELFYDPQFHLYALLALKKGLIDGMTFTTSQLFYNALRSRSLFGAPIIPLFVKDAPNPVAWEIIKETSRKDSGTFKYDPSNRNQATFLTDDQLHKFFELMRPLPTFERQFMLVRDTRPLRGDTPERRRTLTHALALSGYNALIRVPRAYCEPEMRMIASKSMGQAHLLAQSEERAPRLITRFLLSKVETLKQQILSNEHDMCLSFRAFSPLKEVDGFECDPDVPDVEDHDRYHPQVLLHIPPSERIKYYEIACLFEKIAKDHPEVAVAANTMAMSIIDMEHREYEHAPMGSTQEATLFWTAVGISLTKAKKMAVLSSQSVANELFDKSVTLAMTHLKEAGARGLPLMAIRHIELSKVPNSALRFIAQAQTALSAGVGQS